MKGTSFLFKGLLKCFPNAEFTLQSHRITAVFTLHDYLGKHSVAALFTLHDGSATEGYTRQDFTIRRIADNAVWSANYSTREVKQDYADIMLYKSSLNTQ